MGFIDLLPGFLADPLRDALKTPIRQSLHQVLNLGMVSFSPGFTRSIYTRASGRSLLSCYEGHSTSLGTFMQAS